MPRLLYALTAVILSYGPSFAATENELRSADVIMPGCRQLSETTPAVSIAFRPLARSDTHADGWRACELLHLQTLERRK